MEDLDAHFLSQVQTLLAVDEEHFGAKISKILRLLVERGFDSARYWQTFTSAANGRDRFLTLVAFEYQNSSVSPKPGYTIDYDSSTIGKSASPASPAAGHCSKSSAQGTAGWVHDLGLVGRHWIDFPLMSSDGSPLGLLAVAWTGDDELVSFASRNMLVTTCSMLGSNVERATAREVHSAAAAIISDMSIATANELDKAVAEVVLPTLRRLLGAHATALFRYTWSTDTLTKIAELCEWEGRPAPAFDETYRYGEFLTGKAFADPRLRHIPDFETYQRAKGNDIQPGSLKRHSKIMGPITTVLYGLLGATGSQYLVRLMNRKDESSLPFTNQQRDVLAQICDSVSHAIDWRSSRSLQRFMQQMAIQGLQGGREVEKLFERFSETLSQVGVTDYCVLHGSSSSSFVDYRFQSQEIVSDVDLAGEIGTEDGSFFAELSRGDAFRSVLLTNKDKWRSDKLHASFLKRNVNRLSVCVGRHLGGTTLLILPENESLQSRRAAEVRAGTTISEFLAALTSIIGAAIEASSSTLTVENAEGLVKQFGHEIGTPVSRLGNVAIEGLQNAIGALEASGVNVDPSLIRQLEDSSRKVNNVAKNLRHQMDIATEMAQLSRGGVTVEFSVHVLIDIVNSAWVEASEWSRALPDMQASRRIRLQSNEAAKKMRVVGDARSLHGLFVNVLKNAIKYSLPRYRSEDMVVEVIGNPQLSMNIVQVRNWGVGVPIGKKEVIFQRFYRVDRLDRFRDIRGIGLGLYLARTFARLHSGTLLCVDSAFTLDDPSKEKEQEGFLTTFELRLPRSLQTGRRQVDISKLSR